MGGRGTPCTGKFNEFIFSIQKEKKKIQFSETYQCLLGMLRISKMDEFPEKVQTANSEFFVADFLGNS